MGEAKRRRKNDPNWGKPKLLCNPILTALLQGDSDPFLTEHHAELLGLAWGEFEKRGRGIVLCPGWCDRRERLGFALYPHLFYVNEAELLHLGCLAQDVKAACLQAIRHYQPQQSIAVCFIFAKGYNIRFLPLEKLPAQHQSPQDAFAWLKWQYPQITHTNPVSVETEGTLHFLFTRFQIPPDLERRIYT